MRRARMGTLLIICAAMLGACGTVASDHRPSAYFAEQQSTSRGDTTGSLFTSDGSVLSDQDISRILAFRYTVRNNNRIAIIALNQAYWYGWSDELARAGATVQGGLVSKLRASPIVYDASYLPQLLVPAKRTVGHFREAGARYQADLMLIYRTSCRTYDRWRFFSPDKAKSFCNVEAVLLDTATGIVPFTVTASRDVTTKKRKDDFNLMETRRRGELQAIGGALDEAGDTLARFIAGLPKS